MNVEIVSIGTEILLGEIVDTNSNHIARTLRDIGANLFFITTVGDNLERIANQLRTSLQRSDVVITTGGLGPTVDDVTRQAVAAATDRELVFKQELLDQIVARFATFGVRMSENNRQQAYVPKDAIVIENEVGTAPSFIVESSNGTVISLPGVPREMKHLLAQRIVPYLRETMGESRIIKALVLKTAGIGESHLDEHIADLMINANPTVGLAAHTGQTDIRITAMADTEAAADMMIQDMETIVRERVGSYIYGIDKDPLEVAFVALAKHLNIRVALFEAGTSAALANRVRSVTGHEAILSTITQLDEANTLFSHNLPMLNNMLEQKASEQLAANTDLFIGIATISGQTTIVVATNEKTLTRNYAFGGTSAQAADWAPTWGLSMAWRVLREKELAQND